MTETIEWLNQNQGFVMILLTLIYVLSTIIIVAVMIRANKLTSRNIDITMQLEQSRTRPHIVVEILLESPLLNLRIKNMGLTVAQDINFLTNPEIKICLGGKNMVPSEETEQEISFLSNGISSLPPGAEIQTIFGSLQNIKSRYNPPHFCGQVNYADATGKKYQENFDIDISYYSELLSISRKGLHEIGTEMHGIKQELQKISSGHWHPLVRTQDEKQYQEKQEELINKIRAKRNQS